MALENAYYLQVPEICLSRSMYLFLIPERKLKEALIHKGYIA